MGNTEARSRPVSHEKMAHEEVPEDNGFVFFDKVLPAEMCEEVFLNVPPLDLVTSVSRVCKNWYHLLKNVNFWIQKVKREGIHLPPAAEGRLVDEQDISKALYILKGLSTRSLPINCNLISNPSGTDGLRDWEVHHGGDRLIVECPPVGSKNIPEEAGLPTQHCFVSSFYECSRSQMIKLKDLNFEPWIVDILRPEISVSEWVSARWDCDAKSSMTVEVFVKGKSTPVVCTKKWSSRSHDVVNNEWYKMDIVVAYPGELSAIRFTNRSQDEQFWAGHYGAKTAGSSVILHM